MGFPYEEVREKITSASAITILSHLNPDADALGTSLGIYHLLKRDYPHKPVEVVNASKEMPRYLDFLPHFGRIKHKIDYTESLVISCDCGSIDRLGFDLEGREIINIDHHYSNTLYGTINVVFPQMASSSQVAYHLFAKLYTLDEKTAMCFYTALLSDTRSFTTSSVNQSVFETAKSLTDLGANPAWIAERFTQRKSLSSVRLLERSLRSLRLYENARVAILCANAEDIAATGATIPDMDGIVDHASALVSVQVALFAMELGDELRVSLRSKGADISTVAKAFGGGGHKVAAGFTLPLKEKTMHQQIESILHTIKRLEVLT